jgi:DNA-directed RNA polymerase I subunit RPA2
MLTGISCHVMQIPNDLEVGYVPLSMGGQYPGLYLFTSASRFVRPVRNISIPSNGNENIELIGPFEQVNIDYFRVHHIID